MNLVVTGSNPQFTPRTARLLRRMFCPLTGLCQEIGLVIRSPLDPRIAVTGGDMTGIHVLRGMPEPRPGAYHIGGSGTTFEEVVISTLGETVERYAQHMALASDKLVIRQATPSELRDEPERVLLPEPPRFFSERQLSRRPFPFAQLQPDTSIGWVKARSLIDGADCWAPAQQVCVGYNRRPAEPQFMLGVTTGTAAHTSPQKALRGALLELIQIDAAMGHWYGALPAVRLRGDARTRGVDQLIERHTHASGPSHQFFWLRSPDLPGFALACILSDATTPRLAVGLGCDLCLERAMYKAFTEAVAVFQLAKVVLFRATLEAGAPRFDPATIFDLDSNVGYYALRERPAMQARFGGGPELSGSDLPPDINRGLEGDIRYLVSGFRESAKELAWLDMTTCDLRDLGFAVMRVWSPDTLSLSLPSAPPEMHPRWRDYGGFANEHPHPYP